MADRIKAADRFSVRTMMLVATALEEKAVAHERIASGLPREYRTGVECRDIDRRRWETERAAECREAIKIVRAVVDRSGVLRQQPQEPK